MANYLHLNLHRLVEPTKFEFLVLAMSDALHVFRLFLVLLIIVIIIALVFLLLVFLLLGFISFFLFFLFIVAESLPFCCKSISLVITDNDVVKDRTTLPLPQVEADEAKVCVFVHLVVILVLWIIDFLCLPEAFVCRVGDALDGPVPLVSWIVLHRGLPVIRLLVLRVIHHGVFNPIGWLLVLRIWDHLGLQHLPIVLDGALINLLLIDFNTHCVVRLKHQPVE